MATTAVQSACRAAIDGQMPAQAARAAGRNDSRCRGDIRTGERDVYLAAVGARIRAVRRDGAGVEDFASLDIDLPAGWAVGVKLAAVDEHARGHSDTADRG